jgi:hypothetical protein
MSSTKDQLEKDSQAHHIAYKKADKEEKEVDEDVKTKKGSKMLDKRNKLNQEAYSSSTCLIRIAMTAAAFDSNSTNASLRPGNSEEASTMT